MLLVVNKAAETLLEQLSNNDLIMRADYTTRHQWCVLEQQLVVLGSARAASR